MVSDGELCRMVLAGARTHAELAFRAAVLDAVGGGLLAMVRKSLTLIDNAAPFEQDQLRGQLTEHIERFFAAMHKDVEEGRLKL